MALSGDIVRASYFFVELPSTFEIFFNHVNTYNVIIPTKQVHV